ncbi:potassium transporter [Macroventuria anomochaeta]|uniref:Potassium transporter n=1 Tax=Macroventuria anomochaeta TaxID=301207 RepID=A0ACB6S0I0_9PLEO|nr:potassium transporter [Macroventuria anomochaeta]KAF2627175.1 potassium transporter [Macroventuria anomochaeta]
MTAANETSDTSSRPSKSKPSIDAGEGAALRKRSRSRGIRRTSIDIEKSLELETAEDEDAGLRDEGGYKGRQAFSVSELLMLAYESVGVIYGDIGTSPLYVFSSTFYSPPDRADICGALSLIIWSLTLIVTLKYVLIILRADNDGEGGTFSTYSLLSRYANISNSDPRDATRSRKSRVLFSRSQKHVRSTIEKTTFFRYLLQAIGVFAVSMVIADGVLTPAQSVLGAVQGLNEINSDISKSTIIGVTCTILVLLFLAQPFGINRFSKAFSPIVIVWLALNSAFGMYNLARHDHGMLQAFNPYHAFKYLVRNKYAGWRSLGGILLCFTGVEVLFAGIGAFSRQAIQVSWIGFVYPSLLLTYIGQAAFIAERPEAFADPFYNCAPPGWLIPSFIIAVCAAMVASQCIITATFHLLAQLMKLSYFPQIQVKHTSKTYYGNFYVPVVNWLLMIGTVLVAAIYNNTASLGDAYGVCVMFVTFFDTILVTLIAILVWRIKPYYIFLPLVAIASIDGTYLSSALVKVPDGGWFTILLSCLLACIFILWRFGKEQQWKSEAEDRFPTTHFVKTNDNGKLELTELFGGRQLSSMGGLGIFFDKDGDTTPIVFSQFIRKLVTAPEVMVFFHLRPQEKPTVPLEERYHVSRLAIPNCYRLVVNHGYKDEVITPDLTALIYEKVWNHIVTRAADKKRESATASAAKRRRSSGILKNSSTFSDASATQTDVSEREDQSSLSVERAQKRSRQISSTSITTNSTAARLDALDRAFKDEVLYIMGKEQMRVKEGTNIGRSLLLKAFIVLRDNTRAKVQSLSVPIDKVIEVGFVKEV